jgi:uncharacterized membrane protein
VWFLALPTLLKEAFGDISYHVEAYLLNLTLSLYCSLLTFLMQATPVLAAVLVGVAQAVQGVVLLKAKREKV